MTSLATLRGSIRQPQLATTNTILMGFYRNEQYEDKREIPRREPSGHQPLLHRASGWKRVVQENRRIDRFSESFFDTLRRCLKR